MPRYLECAGGATVEDYVKIGANCTILPAVRIGRHAMIGAGTVVVQDVGEKAVMRILDSELMFQQVDALRFHLPVRPQVL